MSLALQKRRLDEEDSEDDTLLGRRRGLAAQIASGGSFQFRVTEIKNFNSFRPSDDSVEYYVYSEAGILYEEKRDGMEMQNDEQGALSTVKNGIIPDDFRTDFETDYTLTV